MNHFFKNTVEISRSCGVSIPAIARRTKRPVAEVIQALIPPVPSFELEDIQRSAVRVKQTGEVFTPHPLVDEMLLKLPHTVWGYDKTFVDPACGDGNFLVRVIDWKVAVGRLDAAQALTTTFGVDLMEDNVVRARQRLLRHAYYAQTLKDTFNSDAFFEFERANQPIVDRNIVRANSLTEWDFENWQPVDSSP